MGSYVEIVNPYIDYSGGKRSLQDLMELSIDDGQEDRPVYTMNRRRVARGFRSGPVTVTATLTVAMATDPEVDWNALRRSKEEFTLGYERGSGGLRYQLVNARVSSIRERYGQDGEPSWEVGLVATELREALS